MKKLITILGLGLIISTHIFAMTYDELYFRVVANYSEDRISDFNNIWNYAEKHDIELTWEQVKFCLDNPTELEVE